MYIRFRTDNNRVVAICITYPSDFEDREYINLNGDFAIAEYNGEIPQADYLTVFNVQVKTDTWTEKETVEQANEKGEIVYEEVEVEKSRTYLTCDLIPNFIQLTEEQIAEQKQKRYESLCQQYIRERYSPTDENKVVREYLADMTNAYKQEQFNNYNAYVETCKAKAKQEVYWS